MCQIGMHRTHRIYSPRMSRSTMYQTFRKESDRAISSGDAMPEKQVEHRAVRSNEPVRCEDDKRSGTPCDSHGR